MVHPSWSDYPHLLADLDMVKNKNHTFKGKPCSVLELSVGIKNKLDWKCSICEHEWQVSASNRTSSHFKGGCPACSNKAIHSDGRNSMATTHPELAIEYQGDATKVVAGTNKRLMWKCSTCEHEWYATGVNRAALHSGCPFCNRGGLHSDGRNSMAVAHPYLAKQYQGDATKISAKSSKKLDWKCETCEHKWRTSGYLRAIIETGCPVCNRGGLHSDGRNSMAITHPKLAADYQGDATKIIAGSGKPQNWKCSTCEHEWKGIRNVENNGCRACLNRIIHSSGKNSMAVTHPELSKEYQGDATKIVATTDERLDWKCGTCQHTWTTQGNKRASKRKQGCPACSNKVINNFDGRNSMANTHPNLAVEYQGDATLIVAGTNKILDWKCITCEYTWKVGGNDRASGKGCSACANTGYDPSQIGYVYIHQYIDETNHWLKCGITGKPTDRFKQLSRAASRVNIEVEQLDIYTFDDGWIAQQCERELLNSLELRFNSEYDIEGNSEFFKYSALEEIKNIIEKYL